MALQEHDLLAQLASVKDIYTGEALVTGRRLSSLQINGNAVCLLLDIPYPARSMEADWRQALEAAARQAGAESLQVDFRTRVVAHAVQQGVRVMPQVRNIIAVASGKGGVGKSTTAVNLALALAQEGARVGVLDADIYGPSVPTMLGIAGRPESSDGKTMLPLRNHGVQAMSMGFLIKKDDAMAWRGPMVVQALEQMLRQTNWDDLDYLVVDMPPGTGDIQLTLSQRVPLTGAVIVSTPQDIALLDARRGVRLFEKVSVPILGLVENMAVHICSQCGHAEHIFGEDGGRRLAGEMGIKYLGALPLDMQIRLQADGGAPTVVAQPESPVAALYREIARRVAADIAGRGKDYSHKIPSIVVSKET